MRQFTFDHYVKLVKLGTGWMTPWDLLMPAVGMGSDKDAGYTTQGRMVQPLSLSLAIGGGMFCQSLFRHCLAMQEL